MKMIIRYFLLIFLVFVNTDVVRSVVSSSKNLAKGKTIYRIKKIVLDAGHGGKDIGCHGGHKNEKAVALAIVLKLGAYIENEFPEIKIVYTRDKDVFIPLFERTDIANQAKADLFISVHCNAMPNPKKNGGIYGTETYTLGLHKVESNFEVAKRENKSILLEKDYLKNYGGFDPASPISHILLSQFQRGFMEQSIKFAEKVEDKFAKVGKRKSKGVKQAGFLVLHQAAMPSVLIESGFLSNEEEDKFLSSDAGQDKIAYSVFRAFVAYKNDIEGNPVEADLAEAKIKPKAKPGEKSEDPKEAKRVFVDIHRTYRIQFAAVKNKPDLQSELWKNAGKVQIISENGLYKCFSKDYEDYIEAKSEINRLKNIGFKDAFLVMYENGKRLF